MNEEYQKEQVITNDESIMNGQIDDNVSNEAFPVIMKNKVWKILFTAILIFFLISMVLIWRMSHKIDQIQSQMNQLQQIVSSQVSSIGSQVGNITYNIDESLKKAQSIVSDYSYRIEAEKIDRKDKTIPVILTVRPKEDKPNLKTAFIIETQNGNIITAEASKGEANSYTATVSVPLVDYFKLSVTFDDGTVQKSEKLEEIYQPFDRYIMKVDSIGSFSTYMSKTTEAAKSIGFRGTIDTTISSSSDGKIYPLSGAVNVYQNNKLIKTIPIQIEPLEISAVPDGTAVMVASGDVMATYYTQFNEDFTLKTDELMTIVVVIKDNCGFSHSQTIYSERIDQDGNSNPSPISGEVVIE